MFQGGLKRLPNIGGIDPEVGRTGTNPLETAGRVGRNISRSGSRVVTCQSSNPESGAPRRDHAKTAEKNDIFS
jgi:hypothetical protein